MGAVILPIVGLLIMFTLNVLFFSKKNISSYETKTYKLFLITTTVFIIVGLLTFVVAKITNDFNLIATFQRIYMSILVVLNYLSIKYCIQLFKGDADLTFVNKVIGICTILFIALILILPLNVIYYDDILDGNGWAYNIALIDTVISFVIFIVITISLICSKISLKKIAPFITLIVLYIVSFILRSYYKELIFEGFFYSYILLIMYHTIENPDMKLLQELHNSKEISDNANEEKTLFIYNLTQDIRNISNAIDDDADYILDSKNWNETYECARNIKLNSAKFITMTNKILDISQVDSANIKTYNSKYNIKNVLRQIINIYSDSCKSKELKFRTNIDHDVPELLYGDGIGLKEVLTTILNNSVKYTKKGFIELNVNTIIKNDICRLIITIEDSGIGIKSEDINTIKNNNGPLSEADKLITLMHGAMLVSSSYGLGTKIKIILDQKMEIQKNVEIEKYEKILNEIKLLAVDDSEAGLKIIEKLLKGTRIKLTKAKTGKECIDKIKISKYDLILLDEELSQITANELIVKIKEIRNFKTPVVLLTKDNSYEYNEEYIKNGFAGYILKPLKKEAFINKINEFTKTK